MKCILCSIEWNSIQPIQMNRKWMFVFFLLFFRSLYAYDCGFETSCTLQEMASALDRSKHQFNTSDYLYDSISSEGNSTIVFNQRLLVELTQRERKKIKNKYVNKPNVSHQICNTVDLKQMLNQGISLKYIYSDQNYEHISTFVIDLQDC